MRDFIFIHVPKTGGMSIRKALESYSYIGKDGEHIPIKAEKLAPYRGKYFSFCFVRNPWDRFVSSYFYLQRGGANPVDKKACEMYIKPYKTFKDAVMNIDDDKGNFFVQPHFAPQRDFVLDLHDNIAVDFIGKFEHIDADFKTICDKIGLPPLKLPALNSTPHAPYWEYYDEESQHQIFRKYNWDVSHLGYKFGVEA
tara:strand:- start:12 stop:602 length:591 start_codon:yes stop_codon:yes gene_type:complete